MRDVPHAVKNEKEKEKEDSDDGVICMGSTLAQTNNSLETSGSLVSHARFPSK
jgi:hypothetical protein